MCNDIITADNKVRSPDMQVVLASHGRLAEGMKDTLGIIFGELPDLTALRIR